MKANRKLIVETPSDREIVLKRQFDAPRAAVFRALTEPALLRRWMLGPPGWTMTVCEIDLRVGGGFRYAWKNTDGTEMAMRGTYREILAPERIVNTEQFEFGCETQAGEQIGTAVLAEANGVTTLTTTILYPSKEARDGTIACGMEMGVAAGYERLDGVLAA
ncbi:SRPBCC family protein [Planctomyces sp. SH-PL14]|uniref:SRPBCC family protein n=1 Tax=Planctomyces sp. SH-PL14 TaxID=1632864 RepID=UPI00078E28B4|nr:SRPBCC family protein [Planctomyces sp. SH-PL14]AMV17477.1 hypothetical protein VT03_06270 [Planctomyces sp. SH-PL14]